jgi:hypothetical protein
VFLLGKNSLRIEVLMSWDAGIIDVLKRECGFIIFWIRTGFRWDSVVNGQCKF